MNLDWTVVTQNYSLLAEGLGVTLLVTAVTLVFGGLLGLVVCAARLSSPRVLASAARGYISFFRVTPELALIFWIYFCLPPLFDLRLSAWTSGTLALTCVAAAYMAEIYRAGIEAIPQGQIEACRALGLRWLPIWLKVLLPQAVRRMMPAFLNYFTEILKNSTLLAGIGVTELAYQAYTKGAQTYRYLELLSAIAIIFFLIIFPISMIVRAGEARLARKTGN